MPVTVRINVKGVSRRKAAVVQIERVYPDGKLSVEEFLAVTVRQSVREYDARQGADALLRLIGMEETEEMAAAGKVSYGSLGDGRRADPERAVANALQCFDDGVVALFADGTRYQDRAEVIELHEGSEVTFVRLTFLAGRMW